jgi:uncharacterized BrkB/YihY/UPF0761 family membrane protein
MDPNNGKDRLRRRLGWLALVLLVLVSLALVALPVWIVQPFKPQTSQGLESSYLMRRWSPVVTLLSLVVGAALVIWLWRNSRRWWRKVLVAIAIIPLLATTWFARQNHFEWMFNPLAGAAYAKINDANYVADSDVVLAVDNNGEAAAYPIRLMAYHHLVQDVVGGTPLLATY